MKKLAEKVALVAQICITFVFVLVCILYMAGTITPEATWQNNTIVFVLVCVLAVIYIGLSAYMLYMHFSERMALKNILLYSDSESTTHSTSKVIKRIAADNSKLVEGVRVRKVQIRPDDKMGFKMRVTVEIKGENASFAIDKLRCLLADSFKNVLGLKFSTIDFRIKKMTTSYVPDVEKAEKQAAVLNAERTYNKDCYEQPIVELETVTPAESPEETETDETDIEKTEETTEAPAEAVASEAQEQSDEQTENGEVQEVTAEPVDDETASAVRGADKDEADNERRMYGTPEESPIAEDIVVEINDENPEDGENAEEQKTTPVRKSKKK